jgi:hypothetical protein
MARIDHGVTSSKFSLDGETFDVVNTSGSSATTPSASSSMHPTRSATSSRLSTTGGHPRRVRPRPRRPPPHRPALRDVTGAPILLLPDDEPLVAPHRRRRALGHPTDLTDSQAIRAGDTTLQVIHTSGHALGAVCLYAPPSAASSQGTPCFKVTRAPQAVPTATVPRSRRPSGPASSRFLATRSSPGHGGDRRRCGARSRVPSHLMQTPTPSGSGSRAERIDDNPYGPLRRFRNLILYAGHLDDGRPTRYSRIPVWSLGDTGPGGASCLMGPGRRRS